MSRAGKAFDEVNAALATARQRITALEAELQHVRETARSTIEGHSALFAEREQLGARIAALEAERDAARADIAALEAEFALEHAAVVGWYHDNGEARRALQAAREALEAIAVVETRRGRVVCARCNLTVEHCDRNFIKGNDGCLARLARRALKAMGMPTEPKPPRCECDKHDTACAKSADYLVTRAGKRIAVCDRCTLTGDGLDDRDLNPDWSKHRPATPAAPLEIDPVLRECVEPDRRIRDTGTPTPAAPLCKTCGGKNWVNETCANDFSAVHSVPCPACNPATPTEESPR